MNPRYFAAVALVALMGASAYLGAADEPAAKPLPPELKLIPADAAFFVSVRVADVWASEQAAPIRKLIDKEEPKALARMEQQFGMRPDQVERFTLILPSVGPRGVAGPLMLFTTTKPYDKAKLLSAMKATNSQDRGVDGFAPKTMIKPALKFAPPPQDEKRFEKVPPSLIKNSQFNIAFQHEEHGDDVPRKLDLNAPYFLVQGRSREVLIPIDDRTFAMLFVEGFEREEMLIGVVAQLLRRKDTGELTEAIQAAAGDHAVVVGVGGVAKQLAGMGMGRQEEMLFGSLLKTESVTVTMDLGATIKVVKNLRYPDAASAKKAAKTMDALRTLAGEMLPTFKKELGRGKETAGMLKLIDEFEKVMDDAIIESVGDRVIAKADIPADTVVGLAVNEIAKLVGVAAQRSQLANNLKQIGLAWHNYHDVYSFMPGGTLPQAKFPVSWRVQILPFIEQDNLYRQYRFDQPWDSEENMKLVAKMPKMFEVPGHPAGEGKTFIRTFTGRGTMLEPSRNKGEFERIGMATIPDGTSNTLMVVEAAEAEVWTKPEGLPLPDKGPLPKLGGHFDGVAGVAMCDGSVRFIDLRKISEATLRNLITRADGNVIGSDW